MTRQRHPGAPRRRRSAPAAEPTPTQQLAAVHRARRATGALPDGGAELVARLRSALPELLDELFVGSAAADGPFAEQPILEALAAFGPDLEGPLLDRLPGLDPRDEDRITAVAALIGEAGLRSAALRDWLRGAIVERDHDAQLHLLSWAGDPAFTADLLDLAQRHALGEDDGTLDADTLRAALADLGAPIPAWLA